MTLLYGSSSDTQRLFSREWESELCESYTDFLPSLSHSWICHDHDVSWTLAKPWKSECQAYESLDICVVTQFIWLSILRYHYCASSEEVSTRCVEVASWHTLHEWEAVVREWHDVDIFTSNLRESQSHICHPSDTEICIEVRDDSGIHFCDLSWIRDDTETTCLFFHSLYDELLSAGSIEVARRVSTSRILQSSLTIEYLYSFLHTECCISPVLIRILSIEEIHRNIDRYSSEYVDDILEPCEVDHHVVIDHLSGDLRYLICQIGDTDWVAFSDIVETIYLARSSSLRVRDVEITRDWEKCDGMFLVIERCEHDRVSQICPIMSLSTYSGDEDISRTYHFLFEIFFKDRFLRIEGVRSISLIALECP